LGVSIDKKRLKNREMNYGLVLGLYDDSSLEVSYNCLYLYPTSFEFTQTNFLDPRSDYFSPFLNVARETPKLANNIGL